MINADKNAIKCTAQRVEFIIQVILEDSDLCVGCQAYGGWAENKASRSMSGHCCCEGHQPRGYNLDRPVRPRTCKDTVLTLEDLQEGTQ